MEQMKAFIEKAKNDSGLMAKLDELSASSEGLEPDKIVELAAEHGFAITVEEYRMAVEQAEARKAGELKEEELEGAAGGTGWTKNRYDPIMCRGLTRLIPGRCSPLFEFDCDHFNNDLVRGSGDARGNKTYNISCNMGAFPPYSIRRQSY
ncbi:MAG: Nif11-like leader peptide family natural product precursor [Clostridiales bacterium]|nr:Nif11-like leader peptide family natural product precursor [Clostridiales bacterium]